MLLCLYIYVYIYIYVYTHYVCIYIYIYIEREREVCRRINALIDRHVVNVVTALLMRLLVFDVICQRLLKGRAGREGAHAH